MNDITHLQIYMRCSYVLSGTRESIQFKIIGVHYLRL